MTTCPCCGSALTGPLPVEGLHDVPLSPYQRRLVDALVRSYPRGVSTETAIEAVYADDPTGGPDNAENIIRILMSRVRPLLRPYGWEVPSMPMGPRGPGVNRYRLVPLLVSEGGSSGQNQHETAE